MKIAIIGAGNVGGALASGWAKAGHEVILGVRKKEAEVILVSVPVAAIVDVAKSLGEVKNKIIVDATNSIIQRPAPYAHGVEAFKALTNCEDVVKCFNSTGFENMTNPRYGEISIDMFVAGSSAKAKAVAKQLAGDLGFAECYDFGGDDKVALLEQFALCWINLAIMQKHGRGLAFKILKR
ncbi:NADPH-dependent F420 reductase [candidate division KSB1 bacterium]|nr:NADPH-dependent F420 reductase [candidate division KSB1 bacterium]